MIEIHKLLKTLKIPFQSAPKMYSYISRESKLSASMNSPIQYLDEKNSSKFKVIAFLLNAEEILLLILKQKTSIKPRIMIFFFF